MAVFWPDTPVPGTAPRYEPRPTLPAASPAAEAPRLLTMVEATLTVAVLLLMSTALVGPLADPKQTGEGPWLRLVWLPGYAITLALMVLPTVRLLSVWKSAVVVSALVGLAFLSVQWSVAPDMTSRRAIALLFTSLVGLYLAARYDWRQMIELVALTFLILAAGSLAAVVLKPDLGVHQELHAGAWRGLWYEKNMYGGSMVRGALACACAAILSPRRRWLWWAGAAFCALMVIPSTSTTAIVGLLAAGLGLAWVWLMRRSLATAVLGIWLALAALCGVAAIYIFSPDLFFRAVGKDPSLTGRTGIWEAIMRQVDTQPWTGFGYAAFWAKQESIPAKWVRHEVEWNVNAADNGWLELMSGLGWTGVILFALTFAIAIGAALIAIRRGPQAYWAVLLLALLGLFSVSESIIMKANDLEWVLYVATLAKLLQAQARAQQKCEAVLRPRARIQTLARLPGGEPVPTSPEGALSEPSRTGPPRRPLRPARSGALPP